MIILEGKKLSGEVTPEQLQIINKYWKLDDGCWWATKPVYERPPFGVQPRQFSKWKKLKPHDNWNIKPLKFADCASRDFSQEVKFYFLSKNGEYFIVTNELDMTSQEAKDGGITDLYKFRWSIPRYALYDLTHDV